MLTPSQLARRSAEDYRDNTAGLIHPTTLERWLSDWERRRPAGVTGDLVVLQLGAAEGALPQVSPAPGVRSYRADDLASLLESRQNGVTSIGRSPARGVRVDVFLRRYRIDPSRDLLLLASGAAHPRELAAVSQAWLALRYWGVAHEHLGLLHGGAADLPESARAASPLAPPTDGLHRVTELGREQFSVLASLGDVRSALGSEPSLLDVRDDDAFEGLALSVSSTDTSCAEGAPHCTAVYGGRIPGALHLPLAELTTDDGARLAPRAQLDAALASTGLSKDEETIVYDDDGGKSAIATFVLLAVLGRPARWYAASFVEWGSLNASHPDAELRSLPADSPWRTDVELDVPLWAELTRGLRPLIFDAHVSATDASSKADRAYLDAPPELPGPGDGGSGCTD